MLKKGAYDLGRKAIYYILVSLILFFVFVYVDNTVRDSQVEDFQILENVGYLSEINKIESCFYYEHPLSNIVYSDVDINKFNEKTLLDCYDKPIKVKLLNRFKSDLLKNDEISVENLKDYEGGFYKVSNLVIARKGYDVAPAILQIEVAIYGKERTY
jgi:hypothetical protein